jgi:hypothetical protein
MPERFSLGPTGKAYTRILNVVVVEKCCLVTQRAGKLYELTCRATSRVGGLTVRGWRDLTRPGVAKGVKSAGAGFGRGASVVSYLQPCGRFQLAPFVPEFARQRGQDDSRNKR